jgi:hypothetical protein
MLDDDDAQGTTLTWRYDIPLLTSRFIVWDFARVVLIAVLVMYALVFATGWLLDGEAVVLPPQVGAITLGILAGLFVLACLLLGNRHGARFTLTDGGVGYEAEARERRFNVLVAVLGVVAGNPTAAGAGLMARGQESLFISWRDVEELRVYERAHVIAVRNSWRTVIRLHCPVELFEQISDFAEECALAASVQRERVGVDRIPRAPWPYYVGMVALVAVLAVFAQAWYWTSSELATRMGLIGAVFVACSVVAEGLGRRLWPMLALPLLGAHFGGVVASAIEPIDGPGGVTLTASLDPAELSLAIAALVTLAVLAAWRLFGQVRRSRGSSAS